MKRFGVATFVALAACGHPAPEPVAAAPTRAKERPTAAHLPVSVLRVNGEEIPRETLESVAARMSAPVDAPQVADEAVYEHLLVRYAGAHNLPVPEHDHWVSELEETVALQAPPSGPREFDVLRISHVYAMYSDAATKKKAKAVADKFFERAKRDPTRSFQSIGEELELTDPRMHFDDDELAPAENYAWLSSAAQPGALARRDDGRAFEVARYVDSVIPAKYPDVHTWLVASLTADAEIER